VHPENSVLDSSPGISHYYWWQIAARRARDTIERVLKLQTARVLKYLHRLGQEGT
jgi:hypothetical protein